jgi:hypothetical protein
MGRKWLLGVLAAVVFLELVVLAGLYVDVDYSCRCGGCERYPHLCMVGTCGACNVRDMSSISDRLCLSCAEAKGVCRHCGEKKRFLFGVEDFWSQRR